MKRASKHKIINALKDRILISGQDVRNIKTDLFKGQYELFNTMIKVPLMNHIPTWLNKLYPALHEDLDDLSIGVVRRVRHSIKKMEAPFKEYDLFDKAVQYLKIECDASLPTPENLEKNFGLTKTAFNNAVDQLNQGNEDLIKKVYLKHFEKCVATVSKQTNCGKRIAYDCTVDALLEIRSDLLKGRIRYGNLQSYFITRSFSKYYKRERKKKIEVVPFPEIIDFYNPHDDKDDLVEKEFKEIVRNAVKNLCDDCAFLLRQFYFEDANMQEIADQMNKSNEAVRKQASRCREKLKKLIGEKFYQQFLKR